MIWKFKKNFKKNKRNPPVNSNNNIRNSPEAYFVGFEHDLSNSPLFIQSNSRKERILGLQTKHSRNKISPICKKVKNRMVSQITANRKDAKVCRFRCGEPCESINMSKLNEYYPVNNVTFEQNNTTNLPKVINSASTLENSTRHSKRALGMPTINEISIDSIPSYKTEKRNRNPKCPREKTFKDISNESQFKRTSRVPVRKTVSQKESDIISDRYHESSPVVREIPKPPERIKVVRIFPQITKRNFMKVDSKTIPVPLPRQNIKRTPCYMSVKPEPAKILEHQDQQKRIFPLEFNKTSSSSFSSQQSDVRKHNQCLMLKFVKTHQILNNDSDFSEEEDLHQNEKVKTPKSSLSSFIVNEQECSFLRDHEPNVILECRDATNKEKLCPQSESNVLTESLHEKGINSSIDCLQHNASNSAAVSWAVSQGEVISIPKLSPPKIPSNPEMRTSRLALHSNIIDASLTKAKQDENKSNSWNIPTSHFASQVSDQKINITTSEVGCLTYDNLNCETKMTDNIYNSVRNYVDSRVSLDVRPNNMRTPITKEFCIFDRRTCDKTSTTTKKDASSLTRSDFVCQLTCTEPLSNEMIDVGLKLSKKNSNSQSYVINSPVGSSCKKSSKMTLVSKSPETSQQLKYSINSPDVATSSTSLLNRSQQSCSSSLSKPNQSAKTSTLVLIPQVMYAHAYRTMECQNYDKISCRVVQSIHGSTYENYLKYEEPRNCMASQLAKQDLTRKDSLINSAFQHDLDRVHGNGVKPTNEAQFTRSFNRHQFIDKTSLNEHENNDLPSRKVIKDASYFHKDSLIDVDSLAASIQSKLEFLKTITSKQECPKHLPSKLDSGHFFNYLSEQLERSGGRIKSSRHPLENQIGARSPRRSYFRHESPGTRRKSPDNHYDNRMESPKPQFKHFTKHSCSTHHKERDGFRSPRFHDEKDSTYRSRATLKCRDEDLDDLDRSEYGSEESFYGSASFASRSFCKSNSTLTRGHKHRNFNVQNCDNDSTRCGRRSRNSPKLRVVMLPSSASRNSRHHRHKHALSSDRNHPQMSGSALFRAAANVTREFTSANLGRKKLQKPLHFPERIQELKDILAEGMKRSKKLVKSRDFGEKIIHVGTHNRGEPHHHHHHHHKKYYIEPICQAGSNQCFSKASLPAGMGRHPMKFSESPRFFQRETFEKHPCHFNSSKSPSPHQRIKNGFAQSMHLTSRVPNESWHHPSYFDVSKSANNVYKHNFPSIWQNGRDNVGSRLNIR